MPSAIKMRTLLETGVHFGHRVSKWNPRMRPFIFTKRNGIHIIDLQQTLRNLHQYHDMIRDIVMDGGTVLFVGTKRQAQEIIANEANRCGMPFVNHRWLGGTLTNWRTIRERIDTLKQLEKRKEEGEFDRVTKKEALMLQRKIDKLQLRLGGIREMKRLPNLLIVVDTEREITAVKEANILKIPVMAMVDTNANPDTVDHILPANDDAMRSIRLIVSALADAVLEGHMMRKGQGEDFEDSAQSQDAYHDEEVTDEDLLGASTLAKLREAKLFEEEEAEKAAEEGGEVEAAEARVEEAAATDEASEDSEAAAADKASEDSEAVAEVEEAADDSEETTDTVEEPVAEVETDDTADKASE